MITANALAVLGTVTASAALADQAGASSKHRLEVEPRMELVGSHGYRVLISGQGATVTIGVSPPGKSERAGTSSAYVARGTVGPNGIHANFRQFGRVDVDFHPTAAPARGLPPDCIGGTTGADTVPGYFTGKVDFEGEDGYTAVRAHRIRGEVVVPASAECPLVAGGLNPLIESLRLVPAKTRMNVSATDKTPTGGLFFYAGRGRESGFYAERFGTVGRIGIISTAYAVGPRSTLAVDRQVSFAKVSPPKPFTGSAIMRRGPGGKRTWIGTLAVAFPGQGSIPLTGTEFHTRFSRSFP